MDLNLFAIPYKPLQNLTIDNKERF